MTLLSRLRDLYVLYEPETILIDIQFIMSSIKFLSTSCHFDKLKNCEVLVYFRLNLMRTLQVESFAYAHASDVKLGRAKLIVREFMESFAYADASNSGERN